MSFRVGEALVVSPVELSVDVTSVHTTTSTSNIIASTTAGNTSRVIVVGSHLDSVPAGPGINDDGSGSAANLAIALALDTLDIQPVNQIKFAFWAAEEVGLVGSTYYVNSLSQQEIADIACYINLDMLGSPNGIRGVYNGGVIVEQTANASSAIASLFGDFFDNSSLAWEYIPFTGRSDYAAFNAKLIPIAGVSSGADGVKSVEQRTRYGGLAQTAFDPCYHLPCDTLENVDIQRLMDNARATASVLEALAFDDIVQVVDAR